MKRLSLTTTLIGLLLNLKLMAQSIPIITMGLPSPIEQLNPITNFLADASIVNEYLYCSLLRPDKVSGKYVPLIAAALPTESADHKSFTYQIHPDAKFNSGRKITAADVVFSLKLLKNPWVNNRETRIQYEKIQDVVAVGEETVLFKMAQASVEGLRVTSDFAILSEEVFDPAHQMASISLPQLVHPEKLNAGANAALKSLASRINSYGSSALAFAEGSMCGPYLVTDWKVGDKIMLQANKKFWARKKPGNNPYFQQNVELIEVRTLRNDADINNGIGTGLLDIIVGIQPRQYYELEAMPQLKSKYRFATPASGSYEYVGLNMQGKAKGRQGYLDDLAVRKALAHMVPIDELMEKVRFGLGERIAADCSAPDPTFRNRQLPLPDFNPAKAKEILKKAGWEDHNGDGLLDKLQDGEEQTLVLECIVNENRPYRAMIAARLQETALASGIIISFQTLPWAEYSQRLSSGDFDMYIGAWVSDPTEDSYHQIWHTRSANGGSNFVGFGNAASDALIEAYDATFSSEHRKGISFQIQELQAKEQPYIFLWSESSNLIIGQTHAPTEIGNYRPGFWIGALK